MKKIFSSLLFLSVLTLFFFCAPRKDFAKAKHPLPAPDYANEKYWIALPWRYDIGDTIPPGCTIPQDEKNAAADVFYVYPTLYLSGKNWNGDLDDEKLNHKCDRCTMFQGSAFNAAGRLFAPRYRQAHLHAFIDTAQGKYALDFAYADVKAAFEYYLQHWNKGRPIILAGHSQGARHVEQLLKDFFDTEGASGTELRNRLIAAYPIGMPIKKNEFKHIPVGDSATQTNCFITWNTMLWGTNSTLGHRIYKGNACVNPLTWRTNEEPASSELNKGGLPFSFKQIDKNVCDAKVNDGLLWIHFPMYFNYYHFGMVYHVSDVNLFYMNIRQLRTE